MNKLELKEITDSVFKRYPNVDKVFATSDGQVFFNEVHAKNHAAPKKKREELEIEKFIRKAEAKTETKAETKTTKVLVAEIEAATTVEAVTVILEAEREGGSRKTVVEAAEAKIEKLKTQA